MKDNIKKRVANWVKSFDSDVYWSKREKYLSTNSYLLKLYRYKKLRRIEKSNNAEIGLAFCSESAVFLSKPYFPHGINGIIISNKAKIGKNAVILHQTTIGTTMIRERAYENLGAPKIGDNVFIGAGAKIIGDIEIGDNCIIGANAVVVKSVDANCTVVGNPMRVFHNSGKYKENWIN